MASNVKLQVGKAFLRERTDKTPSFIIEEATIRIGASELAGVLDKVKPVAHEKYGDQYTFRVQILDGKEGKWAKFYIDAFDHPEVEGMVDSKATPATASPF